MITPLIVRIIFLSELMSIVYPSFERELSLRLDEAWDQLYRQARFEHGEKP